MNNTTTISCKRCDKKIWVSDFVEESNKCERVKCPMQTNAMWETVAAIRKCYPEDMIPVEKGQIIEHEEEKEVVHSSPHVYHGDEYCGY